MKHGFYITKRTFSKRVIKIVSINVVGNLQVGEVFKLVALGQIINSDDVVNAARV